MWIKQIKTRNSPKGKIFFQYILSETYRVEGVVKHKSVLYLGNHELLRDKQTRQILGKLIENKIRRTPEFSDELFGTSDELLGTSDELAALAEKYYEKYLLKISARNSPDESAAQEDAKRYISVDPSSTTVFNCREIGAEWMCRNMLDRIGLRDYLARKGWDKQTIELAMVSVISRATACFSEHKTERWLDQNSALTELFDNLPAKITRHYLYKSANQLYDIAEDLEKFFYGRMTNMFDIDDKILIYDLTNTYFEGRKDASDIARFGRSKEKRYDCKQVVLAAVVNRHGFLKHSKIYEGNMSDPATLSDIIEQLQKSDGLSRDRFIVLDAGIATEENLLSLRSKGMKYVCVSRSKLKNYENIDLSDPTIIKDKNGSEISLKTIENKDFPDRWMYVSSKRKALKEESMSLKAAERFELEMESVNKGIHKKGGTKKIEKVWERIGRIKERNSSVHQRYNIEVKSSDGKATEIIWREKPVKSKRSGVYFIRTNSEIKDETMIWEIYNTIREVESAFRCLKTDLSLRPVYHKKDSNIESHLSLGLLAYQIVAPIRHMLKEKGITHSWKNIVQIMNTQKAVSVKQKTNDGNEIVIRTCSRPSAEALSIYKALGISSMPFKIKKFVVQY